MGKSKLSYLWRRIPGLLQKSIVSIFALLSIFLALELAIRIIKDCFVFSNFITNPQTTVKFDPELGWIPNPGQYKIISKYKERVTILESGIRSNGFPGKNFADNAHKILVVGDSFAYGDHVSDTETWPSFLEQATNNKVLNGGVAGYSLTQIVFRADKLLKYFKPDYLIISFIPDDLFRSYLIRTSKLLPYYDIVNNEVVRTSLPYPVPEQKRFNTAHRLLGYSLFFDFVYKRVEKGIIRNQRASLDQPIDFDSLEQKCLLLFDKVERYLQTSPNLKKIIILIQHPPFSKFHKIELLNRILKKIEHKPFEILDLSNSLKDIKKNDLSSYNVLYLDDYHMSPKGNEFVAQELRKYF